MDERYSAFISYSHSDERVAQWLHRAIESFRFPRAIRGSESEFGKVPARLPPVFRDRDELAASADLGAELRSALAGSRFQIVLCSPRAAQSKWVNEEILAFKRTHGEQRTLALIVEGEPYAGGEQECFPPALRYKLAPDGTLSTDPAEPIAADLRKGKDGRRLALLKLVAGLSGTRLDLLVRRDAARRQRRLALLTAASSLVAVITIGLAIFAEGQRRAAVEQREAAESSLSFLIGTFEIANPAKENPRTITALTILDRASTRAQREFATKPGIAASLLRATGGIYYNLGLPEQSKRDLEKALALEPASGTGRVSTLLKLAALAKVKRDPAELAKRLAMAEAVMREGSLTDPKLQAGVAEQHGNLAYLIADYTAAVTFYRKATRRISALPGDHNEDLVVLLSVEALAQVQLSNTTAAVRLYAQAARLTVAAHGYDDVRSARALHNLALAFFAAGQPRRAAALMSKAVAIYGRVLEPDHPSLAAAHLLLGRIRAALAEFQSSRRDFAEARRIQTVLNGANNPAVGDVDFFAAEAESESGSLTNALSLADNVKRIYDLNYGPNDPDQAELLLLRARILAHANKKSQAFIECGRGLGLQKSLRQPHATIIHTSSFCEQLKDR